MGICTVLTDLPESWCAGLSAKSVLDFLGIISNPSQEHGREHALHVLDVQWQQTLEWWWAGIMQS